MQHRYYITFLMFLFSVLVPIPVNGALFENLGTSTKAMSMGNAITANPNGVKTAIHYNPAGLVNLDHRRFETELLKPNLSFKTAFETPKGGNGFPGTDPVSGTSGTAQNASGYIPGSGLTTINSSFAVPSSVGFTYRPENYDIVFANAFYAPVATGFKRDKASPTRFGGEELALQRITYASPSVGYSVSDNFHIGASLGLNHAAFGIKTGIRSPALANLANQATCPGGGQCRLGTYDAAADLSFEVENNFVPSYNLGLLWEASPGVTIGASYRSSVETTMKGDYEFRYSEDLQNFIDDVSTVDLVGVGRVLNVPQNSTEKESGTARFPFEFPSHFRLGAHIEPTNRFSFNLDYAWTDWGSFEEFQWKFDKETDLLQLTKNLPNIQPQTLTIPRGYRSTANWSIGGEYKLTDNQTIRAGYEPRKSSVPTDKIDTIAPLPDTNLYGLGYGFTLPPNQKTTVDLSAIYVTGETTVKAGQSCNLNCSSVLETIYNPYAGLNVHFESNALFMGATVKTKF